MEMTKNNLFKIIDMFFDDIEADVLKIKEQKEKKQNKR